MADGTMTVKEETAVPVFTKAAIIGSAKYSRRKDLLTALLKDGQKYTFDEVDNILNNFMNREVK